MWFKKQSVLQAESHYDTEKSADGTTDMRTTQNVYTNNSSSINNSGLPSAVDAGNYFYLPALGVYSSGHLNLAGDYGHYWSSSAYPWFSGMYPWLSENAYLMMFNSSYVTVVSDSRVSGCRVGRFE